MRRTLPFVIATLMACGGGSKAELAPISPVTARVNEPLMVALPVVGGGGDLSFDFEGPELPGLRATVSGGAGGGTFRWTPLASHVGTHEFSILLLRGGSEIDRSPLIVTVEASADAAPVFIRPGAGGTYDLTRTPCIELAIEVRDDDSLDVEIRPAADLPEGASLTQTDRKTGMVEWCPSGDQVAASERWILPLEADDGDHPPTRLDYVAVLRGEAKPGCPGEAPVVRIDAPGDGARVAGAAGYEVRATVTDDMGLRDAPLLFYTTSAPDDPESPDVTTFEQLVMMPSMGAWSARIPPLPLEDGSSREIFFVVSATDNDDPSGASCDHRTDSALRTFEAVGGGGGDLLADCEACSASAQCQSGLCATTASGGRCVPSCSGGGECSAGSCGATPSSEGAVRAGCGPVDEICGAGSSCTNDGNEPNDSSATATSWSSGAMGQICRGDVDHWRVAVSAGTRVEATLDGFTHASGDLDLQLLDGTGTILGTSAGTANTERVTHCFATAGTAIARVSGYEDSENAYAITLATTADPGMCCAPDSNEPNDSAAAARALTLSGGTGSFEGRICPRDADWYSFTVAGPSRVEVLLLIDSADQDLDLELLNPSGVQVGSSRGIDAEESIDVRVTDAGRYTVRVYGVGSDSSPYLGEVTVTEESTCTTSADCPLDRVCNAGACVPRACSGATCPTNHACPTAGPSATPSECGASCTANSGCRSGEACKWLVEGRYCGRT
ncbi:MAG: PPC domain-containing protein, partial [Myxococcales bacterium]|nr:PPC domain-containing protein [Myxococcales bacterium]